MGSASLVGCGWLDFCEPPEMAKKSMESHLIERVMVFRFLYFDVNI